MTGPTTRVSESVHAELRAAILGGRLAAGDALPSERALSESHGVNRHAVREAIKRLQQAGLVEITHGGATRVRDWRTHGGLELLADLPAEPELLRSAAEMRVCIGADAARLCASRGSAAARAAVLLAAHESVGIDGYERVWDRILAGAGNVAYRLAYNALVAARVHGTVDTRIYAAEYDDGAAIAALAEAIAAGDAQLAHDLASALLERTLEGLL